MAKLGVDVDLLVNNAGFGLRGRFSELPVERQAEMVRVNCEAVVVLTGAFLPAMIERGRGGVITVASTAGMQPLPYEATYGASKAFALNLTDALHAELKGTGVKVALGQPGPGADRMAAGRRLRRGRRRDDARRDRGRPGRPRGDCAAYDRGKRSMVPGRFFRNFMRINNASPRAVRLAVGERLYRPKPSAASRKTGWVGARSQPEGIHDGYGHHQRPRTIP